MIVYIEMDHIRFTYIMQSTTSMYERLHEINTQIVLLVENPPSSLEMSKGMVNCKSS